MSRKRKIEALGANIASAALSDMVSRGIGAMVGKLEEHRRRPDDVDDGEEEVERVDTLVTMVRAAAEATDGVHIRSLWLRRWIWKMHDAAFEGANAVRSFRQQAAEEGGARREGPWWSRLLRSAGSLLFFSSRNGGA
ncbi:unnamed protein product [Urochloa humidicola]